MKKLIYQVYLGGRSKLYDYCTESVKQYAESIGADYICQKQPILRIAPNPFLNQREGKTGGWKKHGYMPIFEKENVFSFFDKYDRCCVVDADIYIRSDTPDIFQELDDGSAVGSVYECDLPMNNAYADKIRSYSQMIRLFNIPWRNNQKTGYDFFNSGVMLYDSKLMLKYLRGMTPKQFLEQPELQDLINGIGPFKWQSDQITLNYWFKRNNIEVQHLDWKWNALYTAVKDIEPAHFVHFFLKDKLPNGGENTEELMKQIGESHYDESNN